MHRIGSLFHGLAESSRRSGYRAGPCTKSRRRPLQSDSRNCVQHFACLQAERLSEIQHGRVNKILPPSTVLPPSDLGVQENAYRWVSELIGSDVDDETAILVEHLHPVVAAPAAMGIKRAHPQVAITTAKARAPTMKTVPHPGGQHSRMKAGTFADGNAVHSTLQTRFEHPPHLAAERFKRVGHGQEFSLSGGG